MKFEVSLKEVVSFFHTFFFLLFGSNHQPKNYTVDLNNHQKHTICKTSKPTRYFFFFSSHHTTSSKAVRQRERLNLYASDGRANARRLSWFFCGPDRLSRTKKIANSWAVIVDLLMFRRIAYFEEIRLCWFAWKTTTVPPKMSNCIG